MMQENPEILVFKTNIHEEEDLEKVSKVLDNHEDVSTWSLDREDADKVLRIQASKPIGSQIIDLIKQNGFLCEELPD